MKSVPLDLVLLFNQEASLKSLLYSVSKSQPWSPERGDALVEGVEAGPVHVPDAELPLVSGHHWALQLAMDTRGALLITQGQITLRTGDSVFRELRRITSSNLYPLHYLNWSSFLSIDQ